MTLPIHNVSTPVPTPVAVHNASTPASLHNVSSPAPIHNDAGGSQSEDLSLSSLDAKLNLVLSKLSGLDILMSKITNLEERVTNVENRLCAVEANSVTMENSVKFMSDQFDQFNKEPRDGCRRTDTVMNDLNSNMKRITEERDQLKGAVEDLQCRSMKMNLVFHGISGESRQEISEDVIRDFIYYELDIDENFEFGNVHRFGKMNTGKPRPIVARFLYHKQRQLVLRNSYKLQGTRKGISEQFPSSVEERRRKLYPVMKMEKRAGKRVKLVRDALYIDGIRYNDEGTRVKDTIPDRPENTQNRSMPRRYSDVARDRNYPSEEMTHSFGPARDSQGRELPSMNVRDDTAQRQTNSISRVRHLSHPPRVAGDSRSSYMNQGQGRSEASQSLPRNQPR
ncbi:hypothetical protein FSP39_018878 [Pinctada imbricata]|uniref:Uncharacterized protein n=1 Tax=Pinctada imbricata TaxID=66713 RepID=A0AA88Y5F4_PINIB|nr:hypothetical protein FSP39_018878 [Pinctada imbricata]